MLANDDALRRLQELDQEASRLTAEETTDPRVTFEYEIGNRPARVDPDGTAWYRVRLFLTPKGSFDLRKIEKVVYVLHPTFQPSRVAVSNPDNRFAVEIESWGDFHAMAIIVFRDTGEQKSQIKYLPIGVQASFS